MGLIIYFSIYILIIFMAYLLALYSNKKRKEKSKKLYKDLKIGKKIFTIGGIYGVINKIEENTVEIKVDDNTNIKFSKNTISKVLD